MAKKTEETVSMIPYDGDVDALIEPALEQDDLKSLLKAGYECEKFVSIPDGGRVSGYFLGAGPDTFVNDPNGGGEKRAMGTWRVRHDSGVILTFLNNSQLGTKLGSIPTGEHVVIQRCGETSLGGGRRVSNFEVFHNPKKKITVQKTEAHTSVNGMTSTSV